MPPLPKENRPARVNSAKWEFVEIFMIFFRPPLAQANSDDSKINNYLG